MVLIWIFLLDFSEMRICAKRAAEISVLSGKYHLQPRTGTWEQSLPPKSTFMGAPQLPRCLGSVDAEIDPASKSSSFLLFSDNHPEWNMKAWVLRVIMLKL